VIAAVALFARSGISQDQSQAKPSVGLPDEKQMAEMMKAQAPGEQHASLKKLAGKFDCDITMKMTADAPEMRSKGKNVNEMIFGDRFMKSDFASDFMGKPFKGINYVGYDNLKKKWVSVWFDDMDTGIMTAEGSGDADGKSVTYTGEFPCPLDGGKMRAFRQVITVESDDKYTFEMYETPQGQGEFLSMKIVYTREK
jgi:hypothetical protein